MSTFMTTFVTLILILIGTVISAVLYRSRFYKQVDQIEHWKNDLENRHIQREISRVKGLNMNGETEVLFEKWRDTWEEIITQEVEKILNLSFDVEDYAATFRFFNATKKLNEVKLRIKNVEEEISKILSEVNELVGSEEKNKEEVGKLEIKQKEQKRQLIAQAHSYGVATKVLQMKMDVANDLIQNYKETTKQGNYLSARELVLRADQMLKDIEETLKSLPDLFVEVKTNLPSLLLDLEKAYIEMTDNEYILGHIDFENERNVSQQLLQEATALLDQANHLEAKGKINLLRERVEQMFTQFEKEYECKKFVMAESEKIFNDIKSFVQITIKSREEANFVSKNYHLKQEDLDMLKHIEKQARLLEKRMEVLLVRLEEKKIAYTVLKQELDTLKSQCEEIKFQHQVFIQKLHEMRKEELKARDEISSIRKSIFQTIRLVERSNLPGLPEAFDHLLRASNQNIASMQEALLQQPINIQEVNDCLKNASETTIAFFEYTKGMVEDAILVEKVIQYGNRYRRSSLQIEIGLLEAEGEFRQYNYSKALEIAATTIHAIDPEAIHRFRAETIVDELPHILQVN